MCVRVDEKCERSDNGRSKLQEWNVNERPFLFLESLDCLIHTIILSFLCSFFLAQDLRLTIFTSDVAAYDTILFLPPHFYVSHFRGMLSATKRRTDDIDSNQGNGWNFTYFPCGAQTRGRKQVLNGGAVGRAEKVSRRKRWKEWQSGLRDRFVCRRREW